MIVEGDGWEFSTKRELARITKSIDKICDMRKIEEKHGENFLGDLPNGDHYPYCGIYLSLLRRIVSVKTTPLSEAAYTLEVSRTVMDQHGHRSL